MDALSVVFGMFFCLLGLLLIFLEVSMIGLMLVMVGEYLIGYYHGIYMPWIGKLLKKFDGG